jgi:acetoin utilization protein AcuC
MPPGATDEIFFNYWPKIADFLQRHQPEFIILQCGADCMAGDPLTHLRYSSQVHYQTAKNMREYAETVCQGRVLALGGGGYNRDNIAAAWVQGIRGLLSE